VKTGVTVDRDKIEFRLFNSSSILNITLREELFSLPKQKPTMHSFPGFMALVTKSSSLERITGVTADRDKIEFRLFNSNSVFNITLREELFSPRNLTR